MMPSLSVSILLHEWRRFLAAAIALGFSAFLIFMQAGLALGVCFQTESSCLANASADLWVSSAKEVRSFTWRYEIEKQHEFTLRLHPEVELLQTFWWSYVTCKSSAEGSPRAWLIPFDRNNNFMCVTDEFLKEFGERLEEPLTVAIDRNGAKALKLQIGELFELNGKRVRLVGYADGYDGSRCPFIFASQATFNYVCPDKNPNRFDYLLLKLKDPSRKEAVRDELNALNGRAPQFIAWTKEDMYWKSLQFWLFNEESAIWLFLVSLALLVGVAITNNSLRSAILASLKEYAALRALGVSRRSLSLVALKQALLLGLAGLALAWGLAWGFSAFARYREMAFCLPLWLAAAASLAVLTAALGSGLLALRILYKTQPAELLR